jgi:hypothetical protein
MRIFWNLFKLVLGLAIAIPLAIFALAATVGLLGALVGLAVAALRIACLALIGVGAFRVARYFLGGRKSPPAPKLRELAPADPYYDAALREVNAHLGSRS